VYRSIPKICTVWLGFQLLLTSSSVAVEKNPVLALLIPLRSAGAEQIKTVGAEMSLAVVGQDPNWGGYGEALSLWNLRTQIQELKGTGVPIYGWYEGIGSAHGYIAEYGTAKREVDDEPPIPTADWWRWQTAPLVGNIRWVGLPSFLRGEDFLGSFTAKEMMPGLVAPTYPDGRLALVSDVPVKVAEDTFFAAVAAGDVYGAPAFLWSPVTFSETEFAPQVAVLSTVRSRAGINIRSGRYRIGIDPASPFWLEYALASAEQFMDAGLSGLWVDNYGMWDTFERVPIFNAFGAWSVAKFPQWARLHGQKLPSEGSDFDVRDYLKDKANTWGLGKAINYDSVGWMSPYWDDDAIWQAYKIYKRELCAVYLSSYYGGIKELAIRKGLKSFTLIGNDAGAEFGATRGQLDIACKELSFGWGLMSGGGGFSRPPWGGFASAYKVMRESAQSRWVSPWLYGSEADVRRDGLSRVLYYEALANEALPAEEPSGKHQDFGTTEVYQEFNVIAKTVRNALLETTAHEPILLGFSTDSLLSTIRPGEDKALDLQTHLAEHYGIAEMLLENHRLYRVLPDWKIGSADLSNAKVVILPGFTAISEVDLEHLGQWVKHGGVLLVTGGFNQRYGSDRLFFRKSPHEVPWLDDAPRISMLSAKGDVVTETSYEKGSVIRINESIGATFFLSHDAQDRTDRRRWFDQVVGNSEYQEVHFEDFSASVNATLHYDAHRKKAIALCYNRSYDYDSDTVAMISKGKLVWPRLPFSTWSRSLQMRCTDQHGNVTVKLVEASDIGSFDLPDFDYFLMVEIEPNLQN